MDSYQERAEKQRIIENLEMAQYHLSQMQNMNITGSIDQVIQYTENYKKALIDVNIALFKLKQMEKV